ncbi:MAG TPA: DMT family transporter [Lutibacter sp.]|nr:DMT family transporter [Lutibacter sp.]
MDKRVVAFILAFTASVIYGISFTIAKEVMPLYIKPYGFIFMRVSGATILFWLISFTIPKVKIERVDYFKILLSAIFGVALNMLTFFKGLSLTTPINGAVIMTTTPIIVLFFSFLIIRERITIRKTTGILLGMIGTIVLLTYGPKAVTNAPNIQLGNLLVFINAASYGLYLIISKPLLEKYHPFHLIKWIYLLGFIMVLPFGLKEVIEVNWVNLPTQAYYRIGFIVFFTTFITYLFNLLALRRVKATTLSVFLYLQPLVASIYAIFVGSDSLNTTKIGAAGLIFFGVYLVSKRVDNGKMKVQS